jgi:hypothetical protein
MNQVRTSRRHTGRRALRWAAYAGVGVALLLVPYAAYAAVAWLRYGAGTAERAPDPLLDPFIPVYEVAERHEVRVAAPAEITFAAARELDMRGTPLNRAIFAVRTLPWRLRGEEAEHRVSMGLLEETLGLGWGVLAEVPDRAIVMGAVTQPWEPVVTFRAIPPDRFADFAEPDHAKIVWTLEVESLGPDESLFRSRTLVVTTDPASRERFRRYWSLFSPGILVIRYEALRMVRAEAERRARAAESEAAGDARER